MQRKHIDRLKKLAKHLMEGKLGHKKFDFNDYNGFPGNHEGPKNKCGTIGCALGECPVIFKKHWAFSSGGMPVLRTAVPDEFHGAVSSAQEYFGIHHDEAMHLFHPNNQEPQLYGGRKLGFYAKRESVARNILAFIEKKAQ